MDALNKPLSNQVLPEAGGSKPCRESEEEPKRCRRCQDRGYYRFQQDGYTFVKKCLCQKQDDLEQAMIRARVPPIFRDATLVAEPRDGRKPFRLYGGGHRDQVAIKSQTEALKLCSRLYRLYLDAFLHHKPVDDLYGLLLYGDCGRGKTRLACSLLNDLIYAGLVDVRFIEYNDLFKLIRFSYQSRELSYQSIFEGLIHTKILVIDDFGTEVSDNRAWVLDNIGYIINERYAMNRPTILTCNYWRSLEDEKYEANHRAKGGNPYEHHPSWELKAAFAEQNAQNTRQKDEEELLERVSYRLKSRIREMCFEFKVEGYDYRRHIGNKRKLQIEVQDAKSQRKSLYPAAKPSVPQSGRRTE